MKGTSIVTIMKIVAVTLTALLLITPTAKAEQESEHHPSRVRGYIHGYVGVSEIPEIPEETPNFLREIKLSTHIIPYSDINRVFEPRGYLGFEWTVLPWLKIEPLVGWDFGPDEPIIAGYLTIQTPRVYALADVEYQWPSRGGYFYFQIEYIVTSWLHAGVEMEAWGLFSRLDTWTWGGGPNIRFVFGEHFATDIAVHARENWDENGEQKVRPELVFRFHILFGG